MLCKSEAITPMEPTLRKNPFDSNEHLFQIKWDGVRCLAYIKDQHTALINRHHNLRTNQYPELITALTNLPVKGLILDGEIVAFDHHGKPNFRRILQRDLVKSTTKAASLVAKVPINYLVFDILQYQGKNVCSLPLYHRQELLTEVLHREHVREQSLIKLVESFPESGKSLYQAACEQGLEGIVAKEINSPYLIGQKINYWEKIKCWQQQPAVVCGLLLKGQQLRSLVLGAYDDKDLVYVGNASSGLTESISRQLLAGYPLLQRQTSALANPPKLSGEIIWLEPLLVVLIRYLEWTEGMKLRSPSVLSFAQIPPSSCRLKDTDGTLV